MCIPKLFTFLTLAGVLPLGVGFAQTATNGPVFRVTFSASCQGFDATKNRIVTTRITDRTIIAQALGGSTASGGNPRNFALVYNPTEDSLQVANATGAPVVDVVHFGGGAATGDARQTLRLTFMFFPGQTNEVGAETNVFGTALITERASRTSRSGAITRANISGRLQFTLVSGTPLGTTTIGTGTNVQICTGLFTTGAQFPSGAAGGAVTGGTTGTAGTNGISGIGGTNGGTGTTTTTPVVIVTTPTTTIPNTTGTTITTFGSTVGMLPSLTGTGALPGLGTTVGTGTVSLTPFNAITPVTLGTPVTTVNVGTPIVGVTTTTPTVIPGTTATVIPGTTTTVIPGTTATPLPTVTGAGTTTGTATTTLTPAGSLIGF